MIYAKIQKEHFLEVRPFALFCARVRFCALVVRPTLWRPNPQKKIESIKDFWNLFPWGLFHLVPWTSLDLTLNSFECGAFLLKGHELVRQGLVTKNLTQNIMGLEVLSFGGYQLYYLLRSNHNGTHSSKPAPAVPCRIQSWCSATLVES